MRRQDGQEAVGRRASADFAEDMKRRTKRIAVHLVRLSERMGRSVAAQVVARQVIRSATSVGANYRAAQRARSRKEFTARLGTVVEESDETMYWIEIAVETGLLSREDGKASWQELNEVVKILATSARTSRERLETT